MNEIRLQRTKDSIKRNIEDAFLIRLGVDVQVDVEDVLSSGNLAICLRAAGKDYKAEIDKRRWVLHPGEDPAPIDLYGWRQFQEDSRAWGEFVNGTLSIAINEALRGFARGENT